MMGQGRGEEGECKPRSGAIHEFDQGRTGKPSDPGQAGRDRQHWLTQKGGPTTVLIGLCHCVRIERVYASTLSNSLGTSHTIS